jgi:hypothetical protein
MYLRAYICHSSHINSTPSFCLHTKTHTRTDRHTHTRTDRHTQSHTIMQLRKQTSNFPQCTFLHTHTHAHIVTPHTDVLRYDASAMPGLGPLLRLHGHHRRSGTLEHAHRTPTYANYMEHSASRTHTNTHVQAHVGHPHSLTHILGLCQPRRCLRHCKERCRHLIHGNQHTRTHLQEVVYAHTQTHTFSLSLKRTRARSPSLNTFHCFF